MPKNPTNGELAILIKGLSEQIGDFKDSNGKEHKELIKHQMTTNGRVNKLEGYWEFSRGAMKVVGVIIIPVILIIIGAIINLYI